MGAALAPGGALSALPWALADSAGGVPRAGLVALCPANYEVHATEIVRSIAEHLYHYKVQEASNPIRGEGQRFPAVNSPPFCPHGCIALRPNGLCSRR